jgi:hypothetical protein
MRLHGLFTSGILMTIGCGGIPQTQATSECGGFDAGTAYALVTGEAAGDPDYCAAERLVWTYDQPGKKLVITNTRVLLNCCGEHSISIDSLRDGRYVLDETDAPEGGLLGGSRCSCMCVYDFRVEAEEIPPKSINVKLKRDVTDDDEAVQTVWQGEWDLQTGAGSIDVDVSDIGPWCAAP